MILTAVIKYLAKKKNNGTNLEVSKEENSSKFKADKPGNEVIFSDKPNKKDVLQSKGDSCDTKIDFKDNLNERNTYKKKDNTCEMKVKENITEKSNENDSYQSIVDKYKEELRVIFILVAGSYSFNKVSILEDARVFQASVVPILQKKMNRCHSDEEYKGTLIHNIYYVANACHRYNRYLKQIACSGIPNGKEVQHMIASIQAQAREEMRSGILNKDDIDAAVSVNAIMRAEDIPDKIRQLDTLECIYAKLSLENYVLLELIKLIVTSDFKKLFTPSVSENNGIVLLDELFIRLKDLVINCGNKYPKIFDTKVN